MRRTVTGPVSLPVDWCIGPNQAADRDVAPFNTCCEVKTIRTDPDDTKSDSMDNLRLCASAPGIRTSSGTFVRSGASLHGQVEWQLLAAQQAGPFKVLSFGWISRGNSVGSLWRSAP
jgi:hypothetical protein